MNWDAYVWNRLSVARHKFINWLGMRGRLHTTARIAIYNNNTPTECWLCGVLPETQEHILFRCCYSKQVLDQIKLWIGIDSYLDDLKRMIRWISTYDRSKFQRAACNAAMTGLVYGIWQAQNDSKWN